MEDNIGLFIKNERLSKDVSLRKLSRESNIAASYLSNLENGIIKTPSYDHVIKIFRALDIDPNFLIHFGYVEGELDPTFIENEFNKKSVKGELQKLIRKEINQMNREQLEATHLMITKYRELMMNVYKTDNRGERQPMTIITTLMKYFQSEHAPKL